MAKPDDVTDIDSWLYNHKKGNIVLGADGSMMVLDPKTRDMAAPVKTIPFKRGIDAAAVLAQPSFYGDELRVQAESRIADLSVLEASSKAYSAVSSADKEYLDAVDAWTTEKTKDKVLKVAEKQLLLAKAEEDYRKSVYPHRKIDSIVLQRKDVDYKTKDERELPYEVHLLRNVTTTAAERGIPTGEGRV